MFSSREKRNRKVILDICFLFLVLFFALYLRLKNIGVYPGWYSDEGTLINIAQNFSEHRMAYLAFEKSILIAGRLPLFPALLSVLFQIFDQEDIVILRSFTVILNVFSILLLFVLVKRAQKKKDSFLPHVAVLLLSIYPKAILYSRFGFSYNLSTVLILMSCWGLVEYLASNKIGWLFLAALSIGFGLISDLICILWIIPLSIIISTKRIWKLLLSLTLAFLPFCIYSILNYLYAPDLYIFDLNYIFFRLNSVPIVLQVPLFMFNYFRLLSTDYWVALSVLGFLMLKPSKFKLIVVLMLFIPFFMTGTSIALTELGHYYFIPLFPFIALGLAALLYDGLPKFISFVRTNLSYLLSLWGWKAKEHLSWLRSRILNVVSIVLMFVFCISPFVISAFYSYKSVNYGYVTPFDPLLVKGKDARLIAAYVNENVKKNELVISSPTIAWLFEAQVSDFQVSLAFEGKSTKHFPDDIPHDHFAFSPLYKRAKYIVVDSVWSNWAAVNIPEVQTLLEDVEKWPLAFQSGRIFVYENPYP